MLMKFCVPWPCIEYNVLTARVPEDNEHGFEELPDDKDEGDDEVDFDDCEDAPEGEHLLEAGNEGQEEAEAGENHQQAASQNVAVDRQQETEKA